MLVTNHVLSGAVIGATVRRPAAAFALGVASHFALDAAPHWGKFGSDYLRVAVPDGLVGLAAMGTMTALAPRGSRVAVLAGMAGAALPDLDKPSRLFFGRSPFPPAVDRFHVRIQQHEGARRAHYEATAAVIFGAVAFGLLRRRALSGSGASQRAGDAGISADMKRQILCVTVCFVLAMI